MSASSLKESKNEIIHAHLWDISKRPSLLLSIEVDDTRHVQDVIRRRYPLRGGSGGSIESFDSTPTTNFEEVLMVLAEARLDALTEAEEEYENLFGTELDPDEWDALGHRMTANAYGW